jgi:hypothetical protein
MRQKRKWKESSERLHLTAETDKVSAMKVPRQCLLVLLVKEDWREGKLI